MKRKSLWERYILSLLVFLICCTTLSQEYSSNLGSPSHGFANGSILNGDVWSSANNQALMSTLSRFQLGYSHSMKSGIVSLQTAGIAAVIPSKHITLGVNALSFGDKNYHENKYGIGLSKKIGEKFYAGVQFDYLNTLIAEYDRFSNITFEAGIYARPNDFLRIAIHAYNPFRTKIAAGLNYRTYSIYKMAVGFRFDKGFIFEEVQTTVYEKLNFISGIEYTFSKRFAVRFGYSTAPSLIAAGTTISFKSSHFSCDFQYHNILGVTPSMSLHHEF